LAELRSVPAGLAFFEAPHRIAASLGDMAAILGPREAVLCREITKLHEEVRRGSLSELADTAKTDPKLGLGEIVIVVAPPSPEAEASADELDAALARALATMRVKDAADAVAGALGLPRREVYARALALKSDG
jgi:16S rRNA (cytidine1402-2'-O)-methyltransferase